MTEFINAFLTLFSWGMKCLEKGWHKSRRVVYVCVWILAIMAILNLKAVVKGGIKFFSEVSEEIHYEKMKLQDEYMTDLTPLLAEFRAEMGADRVLYFEFHNSEESLDGMPYKFFDLLKCMPKYGIAEIPGRAYKDTGASMYSELFQDLSDGQTVICTGPYDTEFRKKYRGVFELFNETDHSKRFILFGIPGIKRPIGFIVVEWVEDEEPMTVNKRKIQDFLPRINAISASIRKR